VTLHHARILHLMGNLRVRERGLEPLSWWYIPKRGIYHQPKVARRRCPGRHVTMGGNTPAGHDEQPEHGAVSADEAPGARVPAVLDGDVVPKVAA
jgi:hypothetical protein